MSSLTLNPSILEIHLQPGKAVTSSFILRNLGSETTDITLRIVPFFPSAGNFPKLQPSLKVSWLKYFKLENNTISLGLPFSLAGGQTQEVLLTLDIPSDAHQADYYATLLASTQPHESSSISVTTSIGSNILATVSPISNPPSLVKITSFTPTNESFLLRWSDYYLADSFQTITFTASAQNLGKYFVKTIGTLKVTANGRTISTTNLIPLNLLSGSSRDLEASGSGLIYQPHPLSVGLQSISLDINSGHSNSHSQVNLILFPFRFSFIVISGLLLLLIILRFSRSKHN